MAGPRPAGTDGSDHEFREQVVSGYQQLPFFRTWAYILNVLTMVVAIVKLAWYSVLFLYGASLPPSVMLCVAFSIASLVVYNMGKPGKAKEKIFVVKVSVIFQFASLALCFVMCYSYYVVSKANVRIPYLLNEYLKATYKTGDMKDLLESVEGVIDCSQLICIILTLVCVMRYVGIKEDMAEQREKALAESKAQ